jgi:hypothetical protein
MAKNKDTRDYPVVRTLRVAPNTLPYSTVMVPVDQFLSKANRRMYRHGRNYSIKIDIDATTTNSFEVWTLADTWMNRRAFQRAYDAYLENGKDERASLKGKNLARWEDFRTQDGVSALFMDPLMYNGTLAPITLNAGEFDTSIVIDKAGATRVFTWGQTTATSYGVVDEYNKAGDAQASPDTTTGDMPYDDLMADNSADMANALQVRGNLPPYDAANAGQANAWVKHAVLSAGASQRLTTGFVDAPCGFVLIRMGSGDPVETSPLSLTVKSGDYKGVHAPSMLE